MYRNIEYSYKNVEIKNGQLFVDGKCIKDQHEIHNNVLIFGGFLIPDSSKYIVCDKKSLCNIYNNGYNKATAWHDCPIRSDSQLAYLNPIVLVGVLDYKNIIKALLNRRLPMITDDMNFYTEFQGCPNLKYVKKEDMWWNLV